MSGDDDFDFDLGVPGEDRPWTTGDVAALLANPIYAINIDPTLAVEHPPLVSEDDWIAANVQGIEELGAEAWLRNLLVVLKGGYVRRSDDSSAESKVGRNEPCPCGSGRKFKHCHGRD